ncbi:GIY-YIG nuclease family protein [Patescibacteria group bacterium]
MQKYYTYLARCNDDSLYAGYTTDLEEREAKHNEGKGARYTRMRRPVKIVYHEEFKTKSEAMKREYQLKRLKKQEKESLTLAQT